MAVYVDGGNKTFSASAAVVVNRAVKMSGSGTVTHATAATDVIIGVAKNSAASGETVDVRLRTAAGTAVVEASAAVAQGAALTATAAGKVVTTTTANDQIIGYALEAASGDGKLLEVLLSTGKV